MYRSGGPSRRIARPVSGWVRILPGMSGPPIGVLVMAYGTASGPDDIERYYTDIRGGGAPSPEHLQELKDRYLAIGNVFPLLDTTRAQAEGLVRRLNEEAGADRFQAYLGMKHSEPFIREAVERMHADGIEHAVGIVMAPHWSGMSVETYIERVLQAANDDGGGTSFTFVRSFHDHPAFVAFLAQRVSDVLDRLSAEERANVTVVFSSHSLPVRTVEDGSQRCKTCDCDASCRYHDGLQETADLVAARLRLGDYRIAWQSAGRTDDPWWGPSVEQVIDELAASGHIAVVVCSAGFVADHLEILYDLDIEVRELAEKAGLRFERTQMPNADPAYLDVLANVVGEYLAGVRTT
jgi:protoporphyrin/coproporphyrin ferrochelatase